MAQSFLIGELSARTGRTVHAIRWYETQGLIPGVMRDRGGRRVYSQLHLDWLDLMDRLRCTRMSIAQMRRYTVLVREGARTLRQRQKLLLLHRAQVRQTIAEWTQALKLIDSKIDFYGEWLATGKKPTIQASSKRLSVPAPGKNLRPQPGGIKAKARKASAG